VLVFTATQILTYHANDRQKSGDESNPVSPVYTTTIDPDQAQTDGGPTASTTVRTLFGTGAETTTSDSASEQIRTSYRETVMVVPHYNDEYDESLAANLNAEFGPDLATPIIENERVTPQLRNGLLTASRHAHESRA
jgi:hypothetical protein